MFGGPKWGGGLAGGVVAPGASFKGGGGGKIGFPTFIFSVYSIAPSYNRVNGVISFMGNNACKSDFSKKVF